MTPAALAAQTLSSAYAEYSGVLLRHCSYRRVTREDAEEIVQDAFMQTYEYLAKGKSIENLKTFLFTVTNHLIIDKARRRKASPEVSLDDLREKGFDVGEDSTPRVHRRMEARQILLAARGLDPADLRLFHLRYVEGLMPADIAAKLKTTPNSVSVRLHRLTKRVGEFVRRRRDF